MGQLEVGLVLQNRYQLIERIGSGGFGKTWKAHDELFDEPVAIKAYDEADEGARARCIREARLLARQTRSAGVVAVRDLIDTGDRVLLVMEYLDGCDLSEFLAERGRLTLAETLDLLTPIADALTLMHAQGLIHRDVSPDNIRVTTEGTAKLIDFGSALDSSQAVSTTIAVKPGYAPTEQYGSVADQGPWTDTYALAATIYHCLTGRAPMDALQRTFHDEMPLASAFTTEVPVRASEVLARGLALDYRARTQTPGKLMEDLRAASVGDVTTPNDSTANAPQATTPATPQPTPQVTPVAVAPSPVPTKPVVTESTAPATTEPVPASKAPAATSATPAAYAPASPPQASMSAATSSAPAPTKTEASAPAKANIPSKKRRRTGVSKAVIAAAAVLVAAFIGFSFISSKSCSSTTHQAASTSTSTISYEKQNVTAETITSLHKSEDIDTLKFTECTIEEGALVEMAKLPSLDGVYISGCNISTLGPLAECEGLATISIRNEADFDGNEIFPREFPAIKDLFIWNTEFSSPDMSFLTRFPELTWLELKHTQGIPNIEFLELLPQLTDLDLAGMDLSQGKDAPLACLPNLTGLHIDGCGVSDLSWASGMTELHTFSAIGNQITSLEPLSACTNLHLVRLSSNQVTTLEPLSGSTDLWYLDIVANQLTDLHGLEGHEALEQLYADANALTNVDALIDSTKLNYCSLSHNQITDASGLSHAGELKELDLSYNQLTNLDFCEQLIKLEKFSASHNQIVDISKLSSCARVEKLALQDNQITDITALANGFTRLASLDLSTNQISSLAPLADCTELVAAAVYDNDLSSLTGMGGKPKLEYLLADGNHITDISDLATSTGVLRALDLGNNQVTSVAALSGLFATSTNDVGVTLMLDHNRLASVDDIATKPNYYLLTLWGNPLSSIEFFKREGMRWNLACIPYIENADYTDLFMTQSLPAPLTIVGAPYDRQAKLLDDAKSLLFEPRFMTEEEADAMAAEKRAELHEQVSGKAQISLVTLEDTEDPNA